MDPIGWWEKIPLEPRLVGPDQLRSPFGLDKGHPHLFFLGYVVTLFSVLWVWWVIVNCLYTKSKKKKTQVP